MDPNYISLPPCIWNATKAQLHVVIQRNWRYTIYTLYSIGSFERKMLAAIKLLGIEFEGCVVVYKVMKQVLSET